MHVKVKVLIYKFLLNTLKKYKEFTANVHTLLRPFKRHRFITFLCFVPPFFDMGYDAGTLLSQRFLTLNCFVAEHYL